MDFLRGKATNAVRVLRELLAGEQIVGIAPIIVQEIRQGADPGARCLAIGSADPGGKTNYDSGGVIRGIVSRLLRR